MTKKKRALNLFGFLSIIGMALFFSYLLTKYVDQTESAQILIQEFGPLSILIISFISGLNALLPVPAASFVPIFTTAGIPLPIVIILLISGTLAADLVAFAVGVYGRKITKTHYPEMQKKLVKLYSDKKEWVPFIIFGFTAFIPFPNEVYLIPLGIIGVKLKQIIIPLLLGTIFYQTFAAYGVYNIFKYLLPHI